MLNYSAPIRDQLFVLETIVDFEFPAELPGSSMSAMELAETILQESGKLAAEIFSPLNPIGDRIGACLRDGQVTLPSGFSEAYQLFVEGGWGALAGPSAYGGLGLPFVLSCAVQEHLASANMAFGLCMLLTQGAVIALSVHASEDVKQNYLPKLVSGKWTGTMNLTEAQAGSDVGALRTLARRAPDGSYRIQGTKIFITWGEHDLTEDIIHLVLARLPDGPPGTKGLSLFLVPRNLPDGSRNDVRCTSIERKLGIHASPTCTMEFGEEDRCIGYLVGDEYGGMRAMFTMMNHARINVGMQGVGIAERAYQAAVAYARERVQSALVGGGDPVAIIHHPDVRRTLMTMRALTQGARALAYFVASSIDRAHAETSENERRANYANAEFLTPVVKAWCTDIGVDVADMAIQIFGGAGYIEATGVAQLLRDARIAPIYEGTNGIQGLDLTHRKLRRDDTACRNLLHEINSFCESATTPMADIIATLKPAVHAFEIASEAVQGRSTVDAAAAATPYLKIVALVTAAWLLSRQAQCAHERIETFPDQRAFLEAKIATAEFFAAQILPHIDGYLSAVLALETSLMPATASW